MTQYAFGSGTLIGKRTDVANTPPALLGTLESVSLDFDRKVEFLLGQYNMPVAAGGGEFKIAGKAKYARLQANQINQYRVGLGYIDDCFAISLNYSSDFNYSGTTTTDNRVMLIINLRTIGGSTISQGLNSSSTGGYGLGVL